MKLHYLPAARFEFRKAVLWYECKRKGTGQRLASEIDSAAQFILANPEAGFHLGDGFRRVLVNKFPFALIFRIDADIALIVSIFHQSRKPNSWRKNLNS